MTPNNFILHICILRHQYSIGVLHFLFISSLLLIANTEMHMHTDFIQLPTIWAICFAWICKLNSNWNVCNFSNARCTQTNKKLQTKPTFIWKVKTTKAATENPFPQNSGQQLECCTTALCNNRNECKCIQLVGIHGAMGYFKGQL